MRTLADPWVSAPVWAQAHEDIDLPGAGDHDIFAAALMARGPDEFIGQTDDSVRVLVGVADPNGILSACSLGIGARWKDGAGGTYAGDVSGRSASFAAAATIPVAFTMTLGASALLTSTGAGRVRVFSAVAQTIQSVAQKGGVR